MLRQTVATVRQCAQQPGGATGRRSGSRVTVPASSAHSTMSR